MHRISKDRLYYSLISDPKFERRLSIGLSDEHIYMFVQRVCNKLCTDSTMVVEASIEGFGRGVHGRFGVDEPWPEWADRKDLEMEGLIEAPKDGVKCVASEAQLDTSQPR